MGILADDVCDVETRTSDAGSLYKLLFRRKIALAYLETLDDIIASNWQPSYKPLLWRQETKVDAVFLLYRQSSNSPLAQCDQVHH
jgi:hypothetical protein